MSGVAPLLNDYKYRLLITRLLASLTGGIKIERSLPFYIHIIQWVLWLFPFLLSLPFLGVSFVWNSYYVGLIYGVILALTVLLINVVVKLIIKCNPSIHSSTSYITNDNMVTFTQSFQYVFVQRHFITLFVHSFISGLTGFTGFMLTDIPVLLTLLPVPAVVIYYPLVWVVTSISLYSLIVHPPTIEMSGYRTLPHQDKLQLLIFVRRPLYVLIFGILYIVLRNISLANLSLYLYLLYSFYCLLPFLWMFGILPSLDALVFWFLEQSLVHLMGGTHAASEIRVVVLILFSLISSIIIAVISISYETVVISVIASGLGFVLSLDIIQLFLIILNVPLTRLIKRPAIKEIFYSPYYTSYYCFESRQLDTIKKICVNYVISIIKNTLLLTCTIVLIYFTVSRQISPTVQRVFHGLIIVFGVFEQLMTIIGRLFCCKELIRNPIHPRNKDSTERFKFKRSLVHYAVSIPTMFLLIYVYPLFMVTYTGINLHTVATIPSIWFGLTTLRLLRKVWQNTTSALHELVIVAILNLALSSDSYWLMQIDLGTQCLLVSFGIHICYNIYYNTCFYFILLFGFFTDSKLRTRNCKLTSFLIILLSPISIGSIITSSILSSPLLPLFTLPILLPVSPRPSFYWPQLIHKSLLSSSKETIFYRQADKGIIKALSTILAGARVQPGYTLFVRFQDRTMLVTVLEIGYTYCILSLQGLELQETSCHSVEVSRMDDISESAYTSSGNSLSYWYNVFPCHVFKASDAYVATVYSDARNNLSGIIDQSENLGRFSSNLYKVLLYILLQYATLTKDISDAELILATASRDHPQPIIEENYVSSTHSSLSSMDITALQRQVFSPHLSVSSPTRTSDIHLQCLRSPQSTCSNKVTPSNEAHLPSTVPLSSRSIALSLNNFPQSWYNHLLTHFKLNHQTLASLTQTQLANIKKLTGVCYSIIDIPSNSHSPTRPTHIYKGFQGNFIVPINVQSDLKWLQDNTQLYTLVLKAQRYAVKLLYDEAALGEVSSEEELLDYMNEYDNDWFIGKEDDEEWEHAILTEKLHLFSMDYIQEENIYTAHVLSLQEEIINFGQVNPSALKGVWSNLSWELQYLTNDDDERYSVQAHSRLIRNIMTQTAAMPLGYHVYESPLIALSHM